MIIPGCIFAFLFFFCALNVVHLQHGENNSDPILIEISWDTHDYNLRTVPSLLAPANPLSSRQFSPIDKEIFANLKQLNVDYARYAAWFPFPHISVAELDPPSGLLQCANVGTNFSVHLSCEQSNGKISKVDFASYGTSTGTCGQMKQGQCHAMNSSDIVEKLCLGKQNCSVPARADLFGDPCKFHYHVKLHKVYFSIFYHHCCVRSWSSEAIINSSSM